MESDFLPVAEPDLGQLEEDYLLEAFRSGWVSSIGAFIERFEKDFATFCGVRHAIAVSNGTVAIHLVLEAAGIGPGDEVIVPDLTFAATAAAVKHAGADPVLVDVSRDSWCLDPDLVERAIGPRTKAIIAVHLLGHPADMTRLGEIARRRNLVLFEDAAEAHGATWDGRAVGGLAKAGCFSFYGNKLLTTGEGGMVTTDDEVFAERVRFLKDHAMSAERRYFHPEVGWNYRMTNLQAALGCAQLERFRSFLDRKAEILRWYREELDGTGVILNPKVGSAEPVCWLVAALMPGVWTEKRQLEAGKTMRTDFQVDSRPFFVPMHEMPPYESCRRALSEPPVSRDLSLRGFCLPSSNRLSREDVARVAVAVRSMLIPKER